MSRLLALSAGLAGICVSRAAAAQACHEPVAPAAISRAAPAASPPRPWSLSVTAEAARASPGVHRGGWQGSTIAAAWRASRIAAHVELPVFRIERDAYRFDGVGDLATGAQLAIVATSALHAGVGIDVTLPTGDGMVGLGMGHVMAMPGAWLAVDGDRVHGLAAAGYGRAFGAGGHHHGDLGLVIPRPMNREELEGSARVTIDATAALAPHAAVAVAVPIGDGTARAAASGGLTWRAADAWSVDAELAVPLVGDAFDARATLALIWRP